MKALSSRDRRALLIGAAILVPSLLYVWGVKPYLASLATQRDQLVLERTALARERALLAAAERGPVARHATDSLLAVASSRLFEGSDESVGGGLLTSYLAGIARRNNVLMMEASGRRVSTFPNGVRVIEVELRAESDFEGIVDFLRALETGQKLVRIEQLSLTPGGDASGTGGVVRLRATALGFGIVPPAEPAHDGDQVATDEHGAAAASAKVRR